ncbi:MAG: 1,4-alpha-glucan branching protein GlgB [Chlamydiia bacterium]
MINLDDDFYRNPHTYLGPKENCIRFYRPGYDRFHFHFEGNYVEAHRVRDLPIFEYPTPHQVSPFQYKIEGDRFDPYAFWPTLGPQDSYYFNEGLHYELYEMLGANPCVHEGVTGVKFLVWAPNAKRVFLSGDFNYFDPVMHPMRMVGSTGIFELFIPNHPLYLKYLFRVHTQSGQIFEKLDPLAFQVDHKSSPSAIVIDKKSYQWGDSSWIEERAHFDFKNRPMNIYELHLGTFHHEAKTYIDLVHHLVPYVKKMGYTHVEFMPVTEYPLDESWGYQCSGYFAPTSRYGTLDQFKELVDTFHKEGIGVIVDWVGAHFPHDGHALAWFDGTHLYEHDCPKRGWHPHWGTKIFNYGRVEVKNFLIASALYWLKELHVDGLRLDAVASMLYLNYGRDEGGWAPNPHGGDTDLEAIEMLKHLNSIVHERTPGCVMIAEDSSDFRGVTSALNDGGLGFDLKWQMGWMNDTLRFFSLDPIYRKFHHNDITFSLLYYYGEKYIKPLSHDEVVHGKKSLMEKMPGDPFSKFAQLRLLVGHTMCMPGKKLFFMGYEIADGQEWSEKRSIPWDLLRFGYQHGMLDYVSAINHLYQKEDAFWIYDYEYHGFQWVDFSDTDRTVFSYLRRGTNKTFLIVDHMTASYHGHYVIWIRDVHHVVEILNSDDEKFHGSGKINPSPVIIFNKQKEPIGIEIQLAPFANMIFEISFFK